MFIQAREQQKKLMLESEDLNLTNMKAKQEFTYEELVKLVQHDPTKKTKYTLKPKYFNLSTFELLEEESNKLTEREQMMMQMDN